MFTITVIPDYADIAKMEKLAWDGALTAYKNEYEILENRYGTDSVTIALELFNSGKTW